MYPFSIDITVVVVLTGCIGLVMVLSLTGAVGLNPPLRSSYALMLIIYYVMCIVALPQLYDLLCDFRWDPARYKYVSCSL